MGDLLDRRNWKLRTVRTIRQGGSGLIRYPFTSPLVSVEVSSRGGRSSWVAAGYLWVLVRVSGSSSTQCVQSTFQKLSVPQWVWIPEGITSYWLDMRLRPWIASAQITVKEFVGDCTTHEFDQLRQQLDRVETKIDRLNP